jgi:hypothetical protein
LAQYFSDWRNPVLLIGVIGTLLFGGLWFSTHKQVSGTAISIGSTALSEQQIVHYLKAHAGKPVVAQLVSSILLQQYADKQGVTVSDSDVDQLYRMNRDQRDLQNGGSSLVDELADEGMSMESFRNDLRTQALQVKLLLTDEQRKQIVEQIAKAGAQPFTLPERYHIRIFVFENPDPTALATTAQNAVAALRNPNEDGVTEAATWTGDTAKSRRILVYMPGLMKNENKTITAVVKSVTPGSCSEPFSVGVDKTHSLVVQVVDDLPAQHPTVENCGIAAGYYALQSKPQQFQGMMDALQAKAMSSTDLQFYSSDYDSVQLLFKQRKAENPDILGGTTPQTAPAVEPK